MNTYRIWVSGQKDTTLVTRQFDTSFAARQWMASRYDLKTFNIVAKRVRENVDLSPRLKYGRRI
jgi:hypothetical protein